MMFTVRGIPVPQGALVRSPAGGLYHRGSGSLAAWRNAIANEARNAMGEGELYAGPVYVELEFTWPRPKSHFTAKGALRPTAPTNKATKPDADKVARAALDALTGVCFRDDAEVAELRVRKLFGDRPGVLVDVLELGR